jgi:hypothetical protein
MFDMNVYIPIYVCIYIYTHNSNKGWGDSWLEDGDWKCDDDDLMLDSKHSESNDIELHSKHSELNSKRLKANGLLDIDLSVPSYYLLSVRILRQNGKIRLFLFFI